MMDRFYLTEGGSHGPEKSSGGGQSSLAGTGGTTGSEGAERVCLEELKDGPGPVMVSDTLCPAVHILGT